MSTAAAQPGNTTITISATVIKGTDLPGHMTPYEWKELTFTPAAFTGDEAPVAARVQSSYTFPSVRGDGTADVRTLDGNFYIQKVDTDGAALSMATPHLGDHLHLHFDRHGSDQAATAAMLSGAAGIITIDGELWIRVEEPVLVLHPAGIWVDVVPGTVDRSRVDAFALTESDQAIARAAELLHESGKAAYPSATSPVVAVLMPDVFTGRHP